MVRWLVCVKAALLCTGLLHPRAAAAQAPEQAASVAVFRTGTPDAKLHDLATALDPIVLSELGKHPIVRVSARPPLDLPATQLALDCVGETHACLRTVAEQASSDLLVAPSIEQAGAETVLTLLYFDARGAGELRSASRRFRGKGIERAVLDAAPELVRELLQIGEALPPPPQAAAQPPQAAAAADAELEPVPEPPAKAALPVVPVIIGAAGLALIGAGVGFGLAANASEDDYASAKTDRPEDVDAAIEVLDRAQTQALLSNLGFGLGGAAAVVGVVLLALELDAGSDAAGARARLAPQLGPGRFGLALQGHFWGADR